MRHEQLLGQTLPCPKCKGAITVPTHPPAPQESIVKAKLATAKPAGSQAAPTASRVGGQIIDSTAMTKVGDVDWDDLLAGGDPSARPGSSTESGPKFRSLNEPDFIPIPSTFTPSDSVAKSDLDKAIHRQAQRNIDSAKRRQMLILAAIGITGSLIAVGCFVIFVQMVGNKPQPVAIVPSGIATEPKGTDEKATTPEINLSEPSVPPVQETIVSPPSAPLATEENGANESPTPPPSKEQPNVPPNTSADMTPAVPTPVPPNPSDTQPAPATTSPAQVNDEPSISSPPIFGIFRDILLQDNVSNTLVEPSSDRTELNIENAPDIQKQVFHPDPKPYPVWAKKSSLAFSSFRQKDISLLRCIDLFGRMTGVGITVDWQSCRVAGIDLSKKIEIDEKDKTIAELVSQVLLSNGLEWSLDPNGLPIVSAPKAAMEAKSQLDWPISGLFKMGSEREGCETLIRLWEYQDVCSFADGRLLWNEQATPIQKANVKASLCELATLQRIEAKPWSEPQETPLIYSPNHWNRSLVALERKTRLTLEAHERRPIPDLLMTAAAETKLNLVIDWQNVWSHGLTPTNSEAIVLGGRTFPQTAKRFLTDYALEIVPILDDTVLLTTREVRRSLIRIVPLRMPKSTKLDDLRQYLRSLAPLVNNRTKFKIVPIPGTDDLFFARICSPSSEQLNDPDIVLGLGWPERP